MENESTHNEAGAAIVNGGTFAPVVRTPDRYPVMARTFAALKHRNFRLYFFGNLITQVGGWLQMIGQGWLVYQLTGSPLYLGLVGFVSAIPVLILSLGAGVIIDRLPRRSVLFATQSAAMLLAFALAALVFMGVVEAWHILLLSFLLGIVNAFDGTARQAFVKDMVGKDDMMNAIALNSAVFNMSRIVGPALAGILIASVGPGWCFLLRGLSVLSVLNSMIRMKMPRLTTPDKYVSMASEIKEGLSYIRHSQTISVLIAVNAISSLFGFAYTALLPAYAQAVLNVGAEELGLLSTASGIGSLSGALLVAALGHSQRKGMLLTLGNFLFPSALIILTLSQSFPLSMLLMVASGFGFMIQNTTANTLVQSHVPDHLRGRVMSVYMLCFFGLSPLGSLQAGFIAQQFGVPVGIGFGAVIALLFSVWLLWRVPRLRRMD